MSSSKKQTKVRTVDNVENADSTGRQRQLKRDEAIRKKLEQDFLKKKGTSSRTLQKKHTPGTVSALRPGQALTVKENMLVMESAQLMAAKRCDCVLVINEDDHLSGIFTAKDIAYRLVAESLDAKTTPVIDIMTKNPMCVTSDTSATEALNLMVSKGFRHLPVCNEEGDIFGLLDITKCLYGALEKMERAFGTSRVLYDAMEGAEKEWAGTPAQLTDYMESLREKMSCPNLKSVLDGTPPAKVKYRTNVREVAITMKQLHTTAVLVEKHHNLAGIFTSKDIVLRVIAAGLNPENCTVVRVMTPNPDTATPDTTVLDALKLMNEGHYLNLPVLDNNGIAIGMVDVLKLTYVTLEQMSSMEGTEGEGPMWGRFWDSFGAIDHTESSSQLSDSSSHHHRSKSHLSTMISPQPSTSLSQLRNYPDISPNESASMVNQSSSVMETTSETFAFKFTSAGQKTHRVVCKPLYSELLEAVRVKLLSEHGDDVGEEEWLSMSYMDDEQDEVLISSDSDVVDAVQLALTLEQSNVKLFVHDQQLETSLPTATSVITTTTTTTAAPPATPVPTIATADNSKFEMIDIEDEAPILLKQPKAARPKSNRVPSPQPTANNTLFLPAAIGFLGVVIVTVFVFSRVQKDQL